MNTTQPPAEAAKPARRPVSITILSWVFIAAGATGLIYHIREFSLLDPFGNDVPLVSAIRLLAIIGGIFALRGHNWARWLLLAWIAYHVVLSAVHPLAELAIHSLLLVVVVYVYFRPAAARYFSQRTP